MSEVRKKNGEEISFWRRTAAVSALAGVACVASGCGEPESKTVIVESPPPNSIETAPSPDTLPSSERGELEPTEATDVCTDPLELIEGDYSPEGVVGAEDAEVLQSACDGSYAAVEFDTGVYPLTYTYKYETGEWQLIHSGEGERAEPPCDQMSIKVGEIACSS